MSDINGILDATLTSHYTILFERQKLRRGADNTRRQYKIMLRHFDAFIGRPAVLVDLTDANGAEFLQWLVDGGRTPRTANKCRDHLLALWRFLARKGIVSKWPDVDPLVEPERVPIAWTQPQLARLFAACQSQGGRIGDVGANLWWHALHAVLWDSAERITAAVTIRRDNLDLHDRWLVVKAEQRKGGRKDKISRLHPDTCAVLAEIVSPKRAEVFPWPWSSGYLWYRYTRLLRGAGLPSDRLHKFHCLRRSSASYFEAAGGNATELLGHQSRVTTKKYIDPRVVRQQHASDLLFRPGESG